MVKVNKSVYIEDFDSLNTLISFVAIFLPKGTLRETNYRSYDMTG